MEAYHWPGNVRELRNVVERAVALGTGPLLDSQDIWLSSEDVGGSSSGSGGLRQVDPPLSLAEIEARHIQEVLEQNDWNKSQSAASLGIDRSMLDQKIKLYSLSRPGRPPTIPKERSPELTKGKEAALEKARIDLRSIIQALEEAGDIGKASENLFNNRFRLTRLAKKHLETFPQLRTEEEFAPLIQRLHLAHDDSKAE
jgi:hypothetical protein